VEEGRRYGSTPSELAIWRSDDADRTARTLLHRRKYLLLVTWFLQDAPARAQVAEPGEALGFGVVLARAGVGQHPPALRQADEIVRARAGPADEAEDLMGEEAQLLAWHTSLGERHIAHRQPGGRDRRRRRRNRGPGGRAR
jgi:hypothetical protein